MTGRLVLMVSLLLLARLEAGSAEEVLDRFLGRWSTVVTIEREDGVWAASGEADGARTLNGRYLEFRGRSLDPPGESDLQLMTHDPRTGLYYQWLFDSSGYRHEATGRWDVETETLTWHGTLGANSFIITDRFVGDELHWVLRETAPDGSTRRTIRGVVKPLKN